jgi:hypothetical protein
VSLRGFNFLRTARTTFVLSAELGNGLGVGPLGELRTNRKLGYVLLLPPIDAP